MALNFPDPNVETTYTSDGITWNYKNPPGVWVSAATGGGGAGGGSGETVIVSDNAPSVRTDGEALQEGDLWWSSSEHPRKSW